MKHLFFIILSPMLLASCTGDNSGTLKWSTGEWETNSGFKSSFPGKEKNIGRSLGKVLTVYGSNDTVNLRVKFNPQTQTNLIKRKSSGDTIFYGTVQQYKDLYFLNKQINDSTYFIYAIKINTQQQRVKGLNTGWIQMLFLLQKIQNNIKSADSAKNNVSPLVESANLNKNTLRLTPENKHAMHKAYQKILDTLPAAEFVIQKEYTEKDDNLSSPSRQDKLIQKIYPNPARNHVTIKTDQEGPLHYLIQNSRGEFVRRGTFKGPSGQINVSGLRSGIYILQVMDEKGNNRATKRVKIIN